MNNEFRMQDVGCRMQVGPETTFQTCIPMFLSEMSKSFIHLIIFNRTSSLPLGEGPGVWEISINKQQQ